MVFSTVVAVVVVVVEDNTSGINSCVSIGCDD